MASKLNRNKVIAAAQRCVQRGQLDKAIREYKKIVEEDPRDVRIWLKIGDLQARKHLNADAVDTYAKVAEYYSEQGFYLKAVAVYKQILRLNPELVDVNLRLAELYKQLGLLNDAMRQYELVSNNLSQQGRHEEALDAQRQIINLDPANVSSRIKLAELYSKQDMLDQAVEEFSQAGDYLRASNRLDDFIKVAERLIYHKPDSLPTLQSLAEVYLERLDPARALQKLQIAFKLDTRDIQTLEMLTQAFSALKQREKTISVLRELARRYDEVGEREKQADVYRRVLKMAPEDQAAHKALGRLEQPPSSAHVMPEASPGMGRMPSGPAPLPPPPKEDPEWEQAMSAPEVPSLDELVPDHQYTATAPEPSPPEASQPAAAHVASSDPYGSSPGLINLETSSVSARAPVTAQEVYDAIGEGQVAVGLTDAAGSYPGAAGVAKILGEADVYIKYGLQDKAVAHLESVFDEDPNNADVRLKLRDLYVQTGEFPRAALELMALARHLTDRDPSMAEVLVGESLELNPDDAEGHALLATIRGAAGHGEEDGLEDDTNRVLDLEADIPEVYAVEDVAISSLTESIVPPPEEVPEYAEEEEEVEIVVDTGLEFPSVEATPAPRDPELAGLGEVIATALTPTADAEPGDVTAGLEDDLEEAEFFIQQSLFNEARAILSDLLRRFPGHPLIEAKLAEMELAAEEARAHPLLTPEELGPEEPPAGRDDDSTAEIEADHAEADPADPVRIIQSGEFHVDEVVREFRRDAESLPGEEDTDTHYDLGIAYREMGLMDDAIKEFKVAMRAPEKQALCHMMIGLCHKDRQDVMSAVEEFRSGLEVDGIGDQEILNLTYELGEAYELAFQPEEALEEYLKVAGESPDFREVEAKVKTLRNQLG